MDKVVILQGLPPTCMPSSSVVIQEVVDDEPDVQEPPPPGQSADADAPETPEPLPEAYDELGAMLAAFFHDEKGTNIVEAVRENSRVQLKIARTLERILKAVEAKRA